MKTFMALVILTLFTIPTIAFAETDFDIFKSCFSAQPVEDCASSDFNADGSIDLADYSIFLSFFAGDLNNDGQVNAVELGD